MLQLRQATPEEREQIEQYWAEDAAKVEEVADALQSETSMLYAPRESSILDLDVKLPSLHIDPDLLTPFRDVLRTKLCDDWDLCSKVNTATLEDKFSLVVTIADTITMIATGLPIPATLIAATIVKMGARNFCDCGDG